MAFADDLAAERARMAPAAPQAPAYQFRDDRNAELDRQAGVQTAAIKANPFMGATSTQDGAAPASAFAPAKVPATGFAGFQADLEAGAPTPARPSGSNPFAPQGGNQVSGAISRLLSNPTGGFDQSASIARENAIKANQTANEDLRGQAALSFMPGTGQAFTPVQQQTDQQLLAMRDFDATNAANRAKAEQEGLQTGISAGLQEQGQRISAEQAAANLAETKRQFNEQFPLQAAEAASAAALGQGNLGVSQGQLALSGELGKGNLAVSQGQLALQTQLGVGDLTLRERTLAQSANQFQDQLSFQKDATAKGFTEQEAQRAWQATQNDLQRASTEKLSMADLSLREKTLAQSATQAADQLSFQKQALAQGFTEQEAQRAWQAVQNDKDRTQKQEQFYADLGLSKEKLALDTQLGLGNLSLEQQKVVNQANQFATEEDFKKYALNAGLDADKAKLAWQSNEAEIQRKWTTGERLSSEEYSTLINKSNQDFTAAQSALQDTLKLTIQGNDQKFQAAQTAAAQAYDSARTDKQMSHEDALAASNQVFQKEMQAAGFTNEQTMQAATLAQQMNIAKMNKDSQEAMHMADLAQSDKQFGAKLGLDYAQLDAQKTQFIQTLQEKNSEFGQNFDLAMKQFGLTKEQVDQQLSTDKFQALLDKAQIVAQLSKDNPTAMEPMAAQLAEEMGRGLGMTDDQIKTGKAYSYAQQLASQGPDWAKAFENTAKEQGISDADIKTVLANQNKITVTAGTNQGQVKDFSSYLDSTNAIGDPAQADQIKTDLAKVKNYAETLPANKMNQIDTDSKVNNEWLDDAYKRLVDKGVSKSTIENSIINYQKTDGTWEHPSGTSLYTASQPGVDYAAYAHLQTSGMTPDQAKTALTKLLGADRVKAALALEGK